VVDPKVVATIIAAVAREVILPRFNKLAAHEIASKSGPRDLVTIADLESEKLLSERLTALLPGSLVVGEEGVAADRAVLDRLDGPDPVWILDPVDGTVNFTQGLPAFGVIVALVQQGRTVAGWIHDPPAGRTAWAIAGEGAWMDDRRLAVAAPVPPAKMEGAFYSKNRLNRLAAGVARRVCSGCAAHDYLRVIEGSLHFALFTRMMPWDHAAGVLIHAEAGGHSEIVGQGPYRPRPAEGMLILAPDVKSWTELRDLAASPV